VTTAATGGDQQAAPAYLLSWTCRYCHKPFKRKTRRGLRVTCPHCGRVQEGPEGIARLEEQAKVRLAKEQQRRERRQKKRTPAAPAAPRAPAAPPPGQPLRSPAPGAVKPRGGLRGLLSGDWEGAG
jgi:sRNA-binding protein